MHRSAPCTIYWNSSPEFRMQEKYPNVASFNGRVKIQSYVRLSISVAWLSVGYVTFAVGWTWASNKLTQIIKKRRTLRKCKTYEPQASVSCISGVFSDVWSVLSQCNSQLRLFHLLYEIEVMWQMTIKHAFSMVYTLINHGFFTNQSAAPGPMYIISIYDNETHKRRKTTKNSDRSVFWRILTPSCNKKPNVHYFKSLKRLEILSELVMTDFCICRAIVSLLSPTSSLRAFLTSLEYPPSTSTIILNCVTRHSCISLLELPT